MLDRRYLLVLGAATCFQAALRTQVAFAEAASGQGPTLEEIRARLQSMDSWLSNVGLAEELEITRARRAGHPNRKPGEKSFHLEIRWRMKAETHAQAHAEFKAFRVRFAEVNGQDLLEKLLFKFVHTTQLPLRSASVHIHVLDSEVAGYLGDNGEFAIVSTNLLTVEAHTIVTHSIHHAIESLPRPVATVIARGLPASDRVMRIIENYYLNKERNGTKPTFKRLDVTSNYIGWDVQNLRAEVDDRTDNWEFIKGHLMMTAFDENALELRLILDGMYAAAGYFSVDPPPFTAYKYSLDTGPYASRFEAYARNFLLEQLAPHIARLPR